MARQARQRSESGNYYIELHGQELYVTDSDIEKFKEIAAEKFQGGRVYGVSVGRNEIGLVVKENEKGISMNMKSVTTMYARYFNSANGREGKLFEGRFKSVPLEGRKEIDEYLNNLDNPKNKTIKKTAARKPAPRKSSSEKKIDKAEPKTEIKQKKNLPSWLL